MTGPTCTTDLGKRGVEARLRGKVDRESWVLFGKPEVPPVFGGTLRSGPQPLSVDYKEIKREALRRIGPYVEIVRRILGAELASNIMLQFERGRFTLGPRIWADVTYAFLASYVVSRREKRAEIVEALKPLYFARVASLIKGTLELDSRQSEARILRQAEVFLRRRRSLADVSRYRRVA